MPANRNPVILAVVGIAGGVATSILSANSVFKGHVWIAWCLYAVVALFLAWAAANVWPNLLPEFLRLRVEVTLIPDSKPAEIQLLTVQNDGPPLTLTAHCTMFTDHKLHHSSFGMVWANSTKTSATLPHGDRCCLMIAKTGVDRDRKIRDQYDRPPQEDLHWIEIVGLSPSEEEEIKERGQWTRGDTPKEYELEITIVGENHKPHTECFTLRTGKTTALEMVKAVATARPACRAGLA